MKSTTNNFTEFVSTYFELSLRYLVFVGITLICAYKLWITSVMPLNVSMFSIVDVTWFYLRAVSIFSGDWMGNEYNYRTLIKGSGYPAFLAFVAKVGISPKLATDLLYLLACVTFYRVLRLLDINRFIAILGFYLLVMNPITFSDIWTTLSRMSLYVPLVILFISAIVAILHGVCKGKRLHQTLHWYVLCGVCLAIAWHTREESIWMVLALGPALLTVIWYSLRHRQYGHLLGILVLAIIPFQVTSAILDKNESEYGIKVTVDFKEPQFSRAWDAVLSLNSSHAPEAVSEDDPWVVLHLEQTVRKKMQIISDRTRSLIDEMLRPDQINYIGSKKGINGSIAIWNFRSAANKMGYYRDARRTSVFFGLIADDIESWCAENDGECRPPRLSKVLWQTGSWERLFSVIPYVWRIATQFPERYQLTPYTLEDSTADQGFRYSVARFFNINQTFLAAFENSETQIFSSILIDEKEKWRKVKSNYTKYHQNFYALLLVSLGITLVLLVFRFRDIEFVSVIATCVGAFSLIFLINLLIVTTAYSSVGRPLSTAVTIAIMFIPIAFGYGARFLSETIRNQLR